ncbi:ABC transporter permease [Sulfitobacter sp. F26204]|uniref:ABC transporter permease n=1 Tax=Sulfitobacter sp. F26204 TaxID=2996014 RepID=UPI00225E46B5|nr:ABC transporter permease [Sulfitobacter sp. F26204]MCX7561747.1 ABC transporter permease [Sulfitobacter sp. F26204]
MDILATYWNLIPVSLAQGAVYAFVALGVMIPFRLLNLPDLTAEGSFPLGAAVCAAMLAAGFGIAPAMLFAVLAGALAGVVTAVIHLTFKVTSLLAGIIVLTMLFSVNIRVMGKPNTALFSYETLFTAMLGSDGGSPLTQFALLAVLLALVCGTLYWFLHTELGLAMRAVGSNQLMGRAQGLSTSKYVIAGLAMAGCLAALGGATMAQYQSYADVNMGVGVLVIGLAGTILGEAILGRDKLLRQILAPIVGSLFYFQFVAMALSLGFKPSDLKLLTGLFVLCALGFPILRSRWRSRV